MTNNEFLVESDGILNKDPLIAKAIAYCEELIEIYDRNIDIDDIMISHLIEILKGRE